ASPPTHPVLRAAYLHRALGKCLDDFASPQIPSGQSHFYRAYVFQKALSDRYGSAKTPPLPRKRLRLPVPMHISDWIFFRSGGSRESPLRISRAILPLQQPEKSRLAYRFETIYCSPRSISVPAIGRPNRINTDSLPYPQQQWPHVLQLYPNGCQSDMPLCQLF